MKTILKFEFVLQGKLHTYRITGDELYVTFTAPYNSPTIRMWKGNIFEVFNDGEEPFLSRMLVDNIVNDILMRVSCNEAATDQTQLGLVRVIEADKVFSSLAARFTGPENLAFTTPSGRNVPKQILTQTGFAVLVAASERYLYYQDENLDALMFDAETGSLISSVDGVVMEVFEDDREEGRLTWEMPDAEIWVMPSKI